MLRINFISGLPRSGSTLLASLLTQHPDCHAHIMSPVGNIFTAALDAMSTDRNEAEVFLDHDDKAYILESIFQAYYCRSTRHYIFDNNRRWTANVSALAEIFPLAKVICCVRSPYEVLNSFEGLFKRYPLYTSKIIGCVSNTTIYDRMDHYFDRAGVIGFAYNALRDAWYGPHRDKLVIVEYDFLVKHPKETMEYLTKILELTPHEFDFENVKDLPGVNEFDARIGTPGLHSLKSKVEYHEPKFVLPPDIIRRMPDAFWRIKKEATKAS